MKKYFIFIFFLFGTFFYVSQAQTIHITQVDTFAIRALPDQPILKIVINTGSNSGLSLERLAVYFSGEDKFDVSSVSLYRTPFNRFSKAEYPGEAVPVTASGVTLTGDSAVFGGLTYPLNAGENIIWIVYNLSKDSKAGRILDGYIRAEGITISGIKYPATEANPGGDVLIRQKYFNENFDKRDPSTHLPLNWTVSGDINADWKSEVGGYSGNPSSTKSGTYNARSYAENPAGRVSRMISKPINLSLSVKPKLTFYHAQMYRPVTQKSDSLGVYYGLTSTGPWKFIRNYTLPTPDGAWIKREIDLPEEMVRSNVYLVFKSTAQWGFGVCVDSVTIYESFVSERKVKSITASQTNLKPIPQGSQNNPVLRVNIGITGNTGLLNFTSCSVTSLNTSNNDISTVKLFSTTDSVFISPVLVGSGTFSGGRITFNGFTRKLESGDNYYWVTYDVNSNATPDNLLDAKIEVGEIMISDGKTYPETELHPNGSRQIKQSIFFDDFENDKGWTFTGEFERGQPQGKGGSSFGFKDPSVAFSQNNIIGTDLGLLTNNGDYNKGIRDLATTPLISARYFKNTVFSYARWLNAENQDSAVIEYQYEGETNWNVLWDTPFTIIDGSWSEITTSTKTLLDRRNFKIRFRLGKTNIIEEYSGWNIDDVFLTGDSIKYDAAITEFLGPFSACGLTAGEQVKVRIKNTGPKTMSNIPVKVSVDGGKSWITETVPGNLTVDNSVVHTFQPINLSKPAIYNLIVKVVFPGDNYADNDSVAYSLMSVPTYSLPYSNGFEKDTTFWLPGGINSSWAKGKPSGLGFSTAYEGTNCWKTDINSGYHTLYENSYIESPCFNFSDAEIPVVDMYYRYYTLLKKSGARLEYSLNGGSSYAYVPEDTYPFVWKWYNDSVRTFHDKNLGWTHQSLDGTEMAWLNGKQVLPAATANASLVRFRIRFKADSTIQVPDPGFAFDNFKLFNAPYDAGVVSIDDLSSPACQYANSDKLKVSVKNFGLRKIRQNDSIVVGIRVNNQPVVRDTFKLSADLNVNDIRQFTMKKPVNISNPGTYKIKAFVIEKLPSYYGSDNDTALLNITVYTNPITNLPDTIFTSRRDTLIVKTVSDPDYIYEWVYDGSIASTTNSVDVSTTGFGEHTLTVRNGISACTTQDTVFIKSLIPDVGVESILSPTTHCGYKEPARPVIRIKNYGTDTFRVNQVIPVKIKLNKETVLSENITLNKVFAPDSFYVATLTSALNLMTPKKDTLMIWTALAADDSTDNDTTTVIFTIHGYPKIFLGNDTVIKAKLSHELDAGPGFSSYLWSDGITNTQKFTLTKPGKYAVTVTDNNNCASTDTIRVHLVIHDLAMQKIVSPVNSCTQSATASVRIQLKNTGTDTIKVSEPIQLYYQVNNGEKMEATLNLATELRPNDSVQHTFSQKIDMAAKGSYSFKIKSSLVDDIQPNNDSLIQVIKVYGNPTVNLGADRIVQALTYTINPGKFASYLWQDNSTDSVWTISKTKFQPSNIYMVTVTDTNGCTAKDTVALFLLINDLQIADILLPRKSCSMSSSEIINLKVTNTGNAPLTNKVVEVAYSLNGQPEVKESFTFNGAVGTSMVHTFTAPLNLAAKGKYSFKARATMAGDVNLANDTATYVTSVLGYPLVDFKAPNDTFVVKLPFTLHAGPGYAEYLWQDNSTDSVFTINDANYLPANTLYNVIVTDENGCTVSESANVIVGYYDLALNGINIPATNCTLQPRKLGVSVKNNSSVALVNKNITLGYTLNGGTEITKQATVTLSKGASQTVEFDENLDFSAVGTYDVNISLTYADDENTSDNSQSYSIRVFGNPVFQFATDTVRTSTFPHTLDAGEGFTSYKWNNNTTDRYLQAIGEGMYTVTVTDANNCSAKDSVYVRNTTGTGSLKDLANIRLYPNPVSNYLYVTINLIKRHNLVLDMISPEGKTVYTRKFENMEAYNDEIDVSGYPAGIYYIRIYAKDSMIVHKVVVR